MKLFFPVFNIFLITGLIIFIKKYIKLKKYNLILEERLENNIEVNKKREQLENIIYNAPIGYMLVIGGIIAEANENVKKALGVKNGDNLFKNRLNQELINNINERLLHNEVIYNETMTINMADEKKLRCLVNIYNYEYEKVKSLIFWVNNVEEIEKQKDELIESRHSLEEVKDKLENVIKAGELHKEEIISSRHEINIIKEQLEWIINTAPISFLIYINNKVVKINERLKKRSGLSVGNDIFPMFTYPEQYYLIHERFKNEKRVENQLITFNLLGGKKVRCLLSITAIKYDGQDAIIGWAIDVEESEKQKDELFSARLNLQTVLDAMPIPVRMSDLENDKIIYRNNSCKKMFEIKSSEEENCQTIWDLLPEYQSNGTSSSEIIKMIKENEGPFSLEVEYRTLTGKIIKTLLTSCIIEYEGRKVSVGIIRDMEKEHRESELRAAAVAAEAASKAKSAFLANMSHEIRTPMNAIVGFAELALYEETPPKDKNDYLKKIKDSSNVLMQIINDILDISKIEAGKIVLEKIPFDMHDVFKVCQTIIAPRALEKGITLYCYTEPSVGKKLIGDPTRLRQVLLNLLTNAVKFTNIGMVKLLAAIETSDSESVTMRFEIKDSGIGMTQEQMKNIFNPFVQADESTTRKYGGTGLGLSITKNIVELMGGELMVDSTFGIGSKFSFVLTFKTIEAPNVVSNIKITRDNTEKPVFTGEVLVCEDNIMNQQVICDHLTRVGLNSVIANNGKECVDIVKNRIHEGKKAFDLIFMDIHMPVMDGIDAADNLTQIGNTSPIIALTANILSDDREIYQAHGMPDYLAKPFKTYELWNCLSKYITPVSKEKVDTKEIINAEDKRKKRLLTDFVRDNQSTFKDINDAIIAGDIKLAHRLVHTLKGLASLMGKNSLSEAAKAVEYSLRGEINEVTNEQMHVLENELNAVLLELSPILIESDKKREYPDKLDIKKAGKLFKILEEKLSSDSVEVLELTDELSTIPGTDILIKQIQDYDFEFALETLYNVKKELI